MNFLDIAKQNRVPKAEINNPEDSLKHYLEWAPLVLGFPVRVFVMTIPAFAKWHKYCEAHDMDYMEYRDVPIHVNKQEYKLNVIAILI